MHFDSARSPQIPGMAAVPSQLVAGGGYAVPMAAGVPAAAPTAPSPPAPPAASPPAAPPSAPYRSGCAPAAPRNGAQYNPPKVPGVAANQYEDDSMSESELEQTRRELAAYREELAQLQEALIEVRKSSGLDRNSSSSSSRRNQPVEEAEDVEHHGATRDPRPRNNLVRVRPATHTQAFATQPPSEAAPRYNSPASDALYNPRASDNPLVSGRQTATERELKLLRLLAAREAELVEIRQQSTRYERRDIAVPDQTPPVPTKRQRVTPLPAADHDRFNDISARQSTGRDEPHATSLRHVRGTGSPIVQPQSSAAAVDEFGKPERTYVAASGTRRPATVDSDSDISRKPAKRRSNPRLSNGE
jgi:hypothetical protein